MLNTSFNLVNRSVLSFFGNGNAHQSSLNTMILNNHGADKVAFTAKKSEQKITTRLTPDAFLFQLKTILSDIIDNGNFEAVDKLDRQLECASNAVVEGLIQSIYLEPTMKKVETLFKLDGFPSLCKEYFETRSEFKYSNNEDTVKSAGERLKILDPVFNSIITLGNDEISEDFVSKYKSVVDDVIYKARSKNTKNNVNIAQLKNAADFIINNPEKEVWSETIKLLDIARYFDDQDLREKIFKSLPAMVKESKELYLKDIEEKLIENNVEKSYIERRLADEKRSFEHQFASAMEDMFQSIGRCFDYNSRNDKVKDPYSLIALSARCIKKLQEENIIDKKYIDILKTEIEDLKKGNKIKALIEI